MRRLACVLLISSACAHAPIKPAPAPAAAPEKNEPEPKPEPAPHGSKGASEPIALPHTVVDAAGSSLDDGRLATELKRARVIYVGEEHPNPHHHAAELEVLEAAFAADPSVGLGLEMLPRAMQSALDRYLEGALDEQAFAEAVDWHKTWGYPFGLYAPLLRFCKEHHLPAYALNAPRELTHAVAHDGVEALPPELKRELPEMKPGPEAHRELVREAFGAHPHPKFTDASFERFYTAQLVWDETMAQVAAGALAAKDGPRHLVVVAGEGHTRKFSIPERAARRGAKPFVTVLPVLDDELDDARKDGVADVYWVLGTH